MKYVALLRGINVGGNNKVDMKALSALFTSSGYTNVQTYINSGNILFDAPEKDDAKLTKAIEEVLEKEFGFHIPVVVRSREEIFKIVEAIPRSWENDGIQKSDILFLWKDFDSKESLNYFPAQDAGAETVLYVAGAILWNIDMKQYNKSSVKKFFASKLYKNMTARNVNTVRKLAELMK